MAIQPHSTASVDDYLAFERAQSERHEYLDGLVYAMAGESPDHGQICGNLFASLHQHLRGTSCRVFTKDMKVRCGPYQPPSRKGLYAYPDVVVVCGAMQFHDTVQDVLLNPTLLIEVLSLSTETFDRGEKFQRYSTWLPTLTDYLLVAQAMPRVEHYHRALPQERWLGTIVLDLHAPLHVETLAWTVTLADIYERVVFPPASENL
jgi:Uma2 family endonuclease